MRATHRRVSRKDAARALAEPVGEGEEERDHREGDEGEAPVEGDHHRHDPDQGEEVAEDGHDARGEQLVHRVHVGGDPRHEPAHRVAVEVAHVQPLQVREDLAPHVLHDPLPGHLHDVVLPEAHDEGGGEGQEVEPGHPGEARRVAGRDVAVDRDLGEVRPHEVDPGLGDDQGEGGRHRARVRAQVAEEPPQQLEVVALGGDRVVVGRPGPLTPPPPPSRSPARAAGAGGGPRRSRRAPRARRGCRARRSAPRAARR